jgi:hypothetical protein
MDRSAIFSELTQRNASRKTARLPLLDLRAEMVRAMRVVAQRVYAEQCENYQCDRQRLRESVVKELRVTRGADFPRSLSGWMTVGYITDRRFRAYLEIEHGIVAPAVLHPVEYGVARR